MEHNNNEAVFIKDTKGDRQNLTYGSLHHYSVPRYRTAGYGHIIGLTRDFRLVKTSDNRREVRRNGLDTAQRPRNQSLFSSTDRQYQHQIVPAPQPFDNIIRQKDYVSLQSGHSQKRRRLESVNDSTDTDTSESSFENNHASPPTDKQDPFEVFRNDPHQRRHRELSEATVQHPADVDAWISLIDYQDSIHGDLSRDSDSVSSSQRRSILDLKVSLYEQALTKVKDPAGRERLVEGLMREAGKIWDKQRQLDEWQKLLKQESSFAIWVLYLNFQQANYLHFAYERCLKVFISCLKKFTSMSPDLDRDKRCIYLALRTTLLMQQAGFSERAVGTWQALLEFNLFSPVLPTLEESFASFEIFWDSEVPRVGEAGAKGWCSKFSQDVQEKTDPAPLPISDQRVFQSWAESEKTAAAASRMPARTLDETIEDDPYRVILYSDVREFLFNVSSEESLMLLLDTVLLFHGLAPLYPGVRPIDWTLDQFVAPHIFSLVSSITDATIPMTCRNPFTALTETSTLFARDQDWFSTFSNQKIDQTSLTYVSETVSLVALKYSTNERIGEYAIALELHLSPKRVRKVAKGLIKHHPTGLRLYNAYALVECRLESFEAGERVWSAALSTTTGEANKHDRQSVLLWQSWVWECFTKGSANRALACLFAMTDHRVDLKQLDDRTAMGDKLRQPAAFLKTERLLQDYLSTALSFDHAYEVSACTDLLALLHYFRTGRALNAALEVYETTFTHLVMRNTSIGLSRGSNFSMEITHQQRARLVHHHATSHGVEFKPRQILSVFRQSLKTFPNNSIFLSLYQHYSQRAGIIDRLREVSQPTIGVKAGTNNLISLVFDISLELARPEFSGSTEHSVRAAFLRAAEVDSSAHFCPAIKVAHLLWETRQLGKQNLVSETAQRSKKQKKSNTAQHAIDAFYDALRTCPWVKELYMICFGNEDLSRCLGHQSLRAVYESIQERGLRLHVDISEMLMDKDD